MCEELEVIPRSLNLFSIRLPNIKTSRYAHNRVWLMVVVGDGDGGMECRHLDVSILSLLLLVLLTILSEGKPCRILHENQLRGKPS